MSIEMVMDLFRDCVQAFTTQSPDIFCYRDPVAGEIIQAEEEGWVVNDGHPVWNEHPVLAGTLPEIIDVFTSELPRFSGEEEKDRNSFIKRVRVIIAQRLNNWLGALTHEIDIDLLSALASEKYESALGEGLHMTLIPYPLKPDCVDGLDRFSESAWIRLSYSNIHAMRKYLNMGKMARLVVCYIDEPGQYGLQESGFYAVGLALGTVDKTFPCIRFKHMEWQFCLPPKPGCKDLNCWVRCVQGRLFLPLLSQDAFDMREIRRVLEPYKNADFEKNIHNVSELVQQAKQQKKGALLIVAEEFIIQDEVERLCGNGCGIKLSTPVDLSAASPELLMELTAIDGAVFADFALKLYACGVILDGGASKGNMARGSRFNSAKSYLHTLHDKYFKSRNSRIKYFKSKYCGNKYFRNIYSRNRSSNHMRSGRAMLGIVVSEDGMVNLLNGLEP